MTNRSIVFVSHANPEDNAFSRWLSLKLAAAGYPVWSDVTKLLGGEDFWRDIEPAIRNGSIKFLYVLSRASNTKPGPLNELRVAKLTAARHGFKDFIIPLRIDDLPHDDINIEIGRLNVIEFGSSWATGLKQLLKKLATDGVPNSPTVGADVVRQWWEREFAADTGVSAEPEVHYSNWFPIELPRTIYRYSTIGLVNENQEPEWSFPTRWHNYRLVTFAPAADIEPGLLGLKIQHTEQPKTWLFLSEEGTDRRDRQNIVLALLNDAWERFATARGLKRYEMANGKVAFYFDLDLLPTGNVSFTSIHGKKTFRGLMGYKTRKPRPGSKPEDGKAPTLRHWHFAVSARRALHPMPMLQLRPHVLFSDDGRNLWSAPTPQGRERVLRAMHRARRSQCKTWWNDDWRDRLLATMAWLAGDAPTLDLPLSLGSAIAAVNPRSVEFLSPVTLREPSATSAEPTADDDDDEEDDDAVADAQKTDTGKVKK